MQGYLILIDFDGTICANKSFHKKAFEQTLSMFDLPSALPSCWFGMTTENVFKDLCPKLPKNKLEQMVAQKRKFYKNFESYLPINKNILDFLKNYRTVLKIKIFSNGSSIRIKKFLRRHALTLDIISFADHGLRKENSKDFLKLIPKGFDPVNVLLIDDDAKIAEVAKSLGINFLHFNPSLDLKGKIDDILDTSSR